MRKKKSGLLTTALAAAAACIVFGASGSAQAEEETEGVIPEGVFIGSIDAGGMTESEALSAINSYVSSLGDEEITLTAEENSITVTADDLGFSCADADLIVEDALNYGNSGNLIAQYKDQKDLENGDQTIPLALKADEDLTTAILEEHEDELVVSAVDYGLTLEDGEFTVIEGEEGSEINLDESTEAIDSYFSEGWVEEASVELPTEAVEPQGSAEELARVQDVLGTFSTDFSSSSSGRAANVSLACSYIDGSVIYPGEEFSVYEAISPLDGENGYELAASYENGTTVESYGGGVCQVSTTLYNAVIRAELEITERYAHSMTVSYVDPSCDAAIAGTYKDLKFVNNTDAPVYIDGYTSGGVIYFTVYGEETRDEGREVIFESEVTGTTEPGVEFQTTSDPIGTVTQIQSSHTGKTAQLWKVVTVDGEEVSREVFNTSTYSASDAIYAVGISSESSEAVAAIKAAIATGDLATVQSAAAEWAGATADDEEDEEEDEEEEETEESDEEDESDADSKKTSDSDSDTGTKSDTDTKSETDTGSDTESDTDTKTDDAEETESSAETQSREDSSGSSDE